MTKKHFEAIAEILANSIDRLDAIHKLSIYFTLINNKFDANKFRKACGVR